jgi:hypothetical protein
MSYILDALKKAERDRLREDPKELDDFASSNWDPYQQPSKSDLPRYLFFLAVLLLVLGAFFIYWRMLNLPQPTIAMAPVQQDQIITQAAPPASVPPTGEKSLALPQLQISGHMYIGEGSVSNRLFANGRSFRQGDKIDEHWILTNIGVEGFEINAAERREILPYR